MDNSDLVDQHNERIRTICLVTLTSLVATYTIYWLRPVLVPLVVAFFVVSGVTPILSLLEKRLQVSRLVAAGITLVTGLVVSIIFGLMIWISILDLTNGGEDYRRRVSDLVVRVETSLPFNIILGAPETDDDDPSSTDPSNADSPATEDRSSKSTFNEAEPRNPTPGSSTDQSEPIPETSDRGKTDTSLPDAVEPLGPSAKERKLRSQNKQAAMLVDNLVRDGIAAISQSMLSLVSTSVLVLIYVFFILIGGPDFVRSPMVKEIDQQIRSYLSLKTVISFFTGMLFGLALRLLGVPMAFTFGVLAFLLNYVPNVGPIVASLLPIPLIIFHPDGGIMWMISTITIIFAIQLVSGNVVEPKLMGQSSDLHPVTILFALMFWGMMWGPIGMFLATPITAALKIILERFDQTVFIAELLAGRWIESTDAEAGPAS